MKKILILIALIVTSCVNKSTHEETDAKSESMGYQSLKVLNNAKTMHELASGVFKGDTIAYNEMEQLYTSGYRYNDFLYYSMYMSNEHHYGKASLKSYLILQRPKANNRSYRLGLYYLLKAYEEDQKIAEQYVNEEFPGTIPTSDQYWKTLP